MESLPLLPGYVFAGADPMDYKLRQKLKFKNGFRVVRADCDPDDVKCVEYDPTLTYGRRRAFNHHEHQRFLPHYALYARKCLKFEGYFKQGIFGSPDEHYRVRRVNVIYYLENDTMAVIEPRVENAGFDQGKLVRRDKVPRMDKEGEWYHWKDLNVGMNLAIYGIVYHLYDCDKYTREFLTSQGIDVGDSEPLPPDPYLRERKIREQLALQPPKTSHSLADDRRYRFLEYDGMVLTFDASWDGEPYKLRYFLADDTISITEVRRLAEGREAPGSLILKRTRVPKNWKDLPRDYPAVCMERSYEDVSEYYSPGDLKIGDTVFIFGRRILLHDCDPFTRRYYLDMLRFDQPPGLPQPSALEPRSCPAVCRPSSITAEDRPARDLIRKLYNFPKRLRYSLAMDAVRYEDKDREFVMEYSLADGAIRINEVARRNSGRKGGCFLGWIRVPKPGSEDCYSPEDFRIGGRLNLFGHWFVVTGVELSVYKYMNENPDKFDEGLKENVREYLKAQGLVVDEKCGEVEKGEEKCGEAKKGEEKCGEVEKGEENRKKELTWGGDC